MPDSSYGRCRIRQQSDIDWEFREAHFDPDFWRDEAGFEATVGGRGASCKIEVAGRPAVLRQYRRGGAVQRLFRDRYFWLGLSRSRPWREWDVLQRARELDLPVPEPLAACVCREGLWYRAALITAFLDGTETMTERLRRQKLDADCWYRLGLLIKRMQAHGIRHVDLTPDNLLMDASDAFYIVDFDMARIMKQLDDWQWQPLYRFQRGIEKRDRLYSLHYDGDDWQAFMDGYQSSD